MSIVGTTHYFVTLADSRKGSLTNRNQAAKEHFKNDLKCELALTVPAAAVATATIIKPDFVTKVATDFGKFIARTGKFISRKLPSLKLKDSVFLQKLAKDPKKFGIIGLAVVAGLYVSKVISAYSNKQGRIDQKYEDAAKIESQTKNVVLQATKDLDPETVTFVK